jgi:hypothetical protein
LSVTAAGGEISCVDSGEYGPMAISKSVSITCVGAVAGVTAAQGVIAINIQIASTDVVTLEGLDIQGLQGGYGIFLATGGTLVIQKCRIRNYTAPTSNGILVEPSSGLARVFIDDSTIINNGSGTNSAGITVRPNGGASVNMSVNHVRLEGNTNGIFADGSQGAGPSNINVNSSIISGSSNTGIAASSPSAAFTILVDGSVLNLNANSGIGVSGAVTARIGDSTIANNVKGVVSLNGATVQSFKQNMIAANSTDGTPLTPFPGPGGTPLQ